MAVAYAQGRDDVLTAVASTPFEFVQDDENKRRGIARVLDSEKSHLRDDPGGRRLDCPRCELLHRR